MKELEQILIMHAARYPEMAPTDGVKLIYQNEFGGGHLIRDEQACLAFLAREYAATDHDSSLPLTEAIGNGIVRVNLAALKPEKLDALGRAFLRSAAEHRGDRTRFEEKLELLRRLTAAGRFRFTTAELDRYLEAYRRAGFPPVSHSDQYRAHYRPAYRIVLQTHWK